MAHAGTIVDVEAADTTFRVYLDDQLLTDVARTTTEPIARFKAHKPEPPRQRRTVQRPEPADDGASSADPRMADDTQTDDLLARYRQTLLD